MEDLDFSLSNYFKEIDRIPLLEKEEEIRLGKKIAQGDRNAIKKLVEANLKFVVHLAKKYQGLGLSLQDLISEGNVGLIKAAEKYDYKKHCRFMSYSNWWIKQTILRAICDTSRVIRIPANKNSELIKIRKSFLYLCKRTNHFPKIDEISKFTNISVKDIELLLTVTQEIKSLDSILYRINSEREIIEMPLKDYISDKRENLEQEVIEGLLRNDLDKALNSLTKKESGIIRDRYGLDGRNAKSLTKLGRKYGLSKERIRQIQHKALKKLRLSQSHLEEYLK